MIQPRLQGALSLAHRVCDISKKFNRSICRHLKVYPHLVNKNPSKPTQFGQPTQFEIEYHKVAVSVSGLGFVLSCGVDIKDVIFAGHPDCLLNTYYFSRWKICSVCRTHAFSPKDPVYYLLKHTIFFQGSHTCTSNTYKFSRSLYFLIEQISIFQEDLFSHRTPESPI